MAAKNRSGFTAYGEHLVVSGCGEAGLQGEARDDLAGSQPGQELVVGIVGGDERAGDHRGHERSGYRAVAEFGNDDREFEKPKSLPVDGLREVQPCRPCSAAACQKRRGLPMGFPGSRAALPKARRATPEIARTGQVVMFGVIAMACSIVLGRLIPSYH